MLKQALNTQTVNDVNLLCAYFTPNWLPVFCMSMTDILLSYPAHYAPPATAGTAPQGNWFIEESFETESHKLSPLPQSIHSDLSSWPCTTANIIVCDKNNFLAPSPSFQLCSHFWSASHTYLQFCCWKAGFWSQHVLLGYSIHNPKKAFLKLNPFLRQSPQVKKASRRPKKIIGLGHTAGVQFVSHNSSRSMLHVCKHVEKNLWTPEFWGDRLEGLADMVG